MRIYIDDFVEDLNYRKVILSIQNVNPDNLHSRLEKDRINHIYRFNSVLKNKLMFVENCDLQDVDIDHGDEFGNSLLYLIEEGYVIYPLQYDDLTKRYFVETNIDREAVTACDIRKEIGMIKEFFIKHSHLKLGLQHLDVAGGGWKIQIYNTTLRNAMLGPIFEHYLLDYELERLNVDFETAIMTPIINWWEENHKQKKGEKI